MPRVRFAYPGYGSRTNLPPHAREPARSCTHNRAADLLALSSAKSISRANTPPIHPVRRSHPEPSPPNTLPLGEGRSPRFVARIRPKAASGEWPCTLVPRRPISCEAPGALRLPGLRVADEPVFPCERAGAVVYAQPCSRPAHASHAKPIRERRGRRLALYAGRTPNPHLQTRSRWERGGRRVL